MQSIANAKSRYFGPSRSFFSGFLSEAATAASSVSMASGVSEIVPADAFAVLSSGDFKASAGGLGTSAADVGASTGSLGVSAGASEFSAVSAGAAGLSAVTGTLSPVVLSMSVVEVGYQVCRIYIDLAKGSEYTLTKEFKKGLLNSLP